MHEERRDIASATSVYPIVIATPVFRALHSLLLDEICIFLNSSQSPKTLGVIGISPILSPYADNFSRLRKSLKKGDNMVCIDYNSKIIGDGFNYAYKSGMLSRFHPKLFVLSEDSKAKIIQRSVPNSLISLYDARTNLSPETIFFRMTDFKIIQSGKLDSKINSCLDGKISMIEADIRNGIPLEDNSVDFFDSTITLHHGSAYEQRAEFIVQDIFRSLKPGGRFFLGESDVNMRYSEKKINMIVNDLLDFERFLSDNSFQADMLLIDARDSNYPLFAVYEPGLRHEKTPIILAAKPEGIYDKVKINDEGVVVYKTNQELKLFSHLLDRGYKNITLSCDEISFPLIDCGMKEDHDLLDPVNEYYDLTKKLKDAVSEFPRALVEQSVITGNGERYNALRGLVEYYCPKEFWMDLFKKAGFVNVEFKLPKGNENYRPLIGAIVGDKPQ